VRRVARGGPGVQREERGEVEGEECEEGVACAGNERSVTLELVARGQECANEGVVVTSSCENIVSGNGECRGCKGEGKSLTCGLPFWVARSMGTFGWQSFPLTCDREKVKVIE
jgi:hypothetical protein